MVIDSSALLAILLAEPDAAAYEEAIAGGESRLLSAGSLLETALVIDAKLGDAGGRELDLLLHKAAIELVPVTADQVGVARRAFQRYGRARQPQGLTFADCFAYALSRVTGEPLLSKRRVFAGTDVDEVPGVVDLP